MYENTEKNWKKMKKKTVQDLKAKISSIKIYFKLRETLKWKKLGNQTGTSETSLTNRIQVTERKSYTLKTQ